MPTRLPPVKIRTVYAEPPTSIANVANVVGALARALCMATHLAFYFWKTAPNFGNREQHTTLAAGYVVLYWWLDTRGYIPSFSPQVAWYVPARHESKTLSRNFASSVNSSLGPLANARACGIRVTLCIGHRASAIYGDMAIIPVMVRHVWRGLLYMSFALTHSTRGGVSYLLVGADSRTTIDRRTARLAKTTVHGEGIKKSHRTHYNIG
jgi:hypothetical protein